MLVLERVLGTHDKEGSNLLNVVKSSEVVVCPVKHIEGSRFIWDGIHPVDIMVFRLRYVEDGWHLGFKVEQSMNFDPSFRPPEMSPFVNAETEVNCRLIKGIDLSSEFKDVLNPHLLSDAYCVVGKLLKDAIIACIIRF